MKRAFQPPPVVPLVALFLLLSSVAGAQVAAPAAAAPEVRITELSATLEVEIPTGFVVEPGGTVSASLLKLTPDPTKPNRVWKTDKVKSAKASKEKPGVLAVGVAAEGFALEPTDTVRLQVSAPLISRTREESPLMEASTRDIPLSGAQLGRLILENEKARGTIVPRTENATATTSGLTVRVIGKLPGEEKPANHAQLQLRVLDVTTSSGTGKEPPELGKGSVPALRSEDLGGVYGRLVLPGVTLKPNQKLVVIASIALSDEKSTKKGGRTVDGRSAAITVREASTDLGVIRLNLR